MLKTDVVQKAVVVSPDKNILLLRRSNTDVRRPLQWDLPGGLLEDGEELLSGVAREVQEESSLEVAGLQCVFAKAGPGHWIEGDKQHSRNVVRIYYTARSRTEKISLSFEHDKYQWVSIEEAINMLEYPKHKEVLKYIIDNDLI